MAIQKFDPLADGVGVFQAGTVVIERGQVEREGALLRGQIGPEQPLLKGQKIDHRDIDQLVAIRAQGKDPAVGPAMAIDDDQHIISRQDLLNLAQEAPGADQIAGLGMLLDKGLKGEQEIVAQQQGRLGALQPQEEFPQPADLLFIDKTA